MRAGPVADEDSAPFWDGLRERRIILQRCDRCQQVRFPPMPGCPNCGSPDSTHVDGEGGGTVYSCVVVHRPMGSFADTELPQPIVTVELAEGCRVLGRLLLQPGESPEGSALIGQAVAARFVDHDGWTELGFERVPAT